MNPEISDDLRNAMRRWTTGVSIVTSLWDKVHHGMTVNSFSSVSIDPPIVTVTLAHLTRTYRIVKQSGCFGVTILRVDQKEIADRFAGRIPEDGDRFHGLNLFTLVTGAPLLSDSLAQVDCRTIHEYVMPNSTLFVGQVMAARYVSGKSLDPLVYFNRDYHGINS
jgi:flavin reductase (DIM6/NTAB) family NADH-FMN oxidoreductase RutF